MDFRFAVGQANKAQSSVWKFWTQGDDAYLLSRGPTAKHAKFSFHRTGNCRWAQINPNLNGSQRAMLEWTRAAIPPAGSGEASLLMSMAFPTDHLSALQSAPCKKEHWIEAPAAGHAVKIELILSRDRPEIVREKFTVSKQRNMLSAHVLRSGVYAYVVSSTAYCGPIEIRIPSEPRLPGQIFEEMFFPEKDAGNTGRPIRLVLLSSKSLPPQLVELGGYEVRRNR